MQGKSMESDMPDVTAESNPRWPTSRPSRVSNRLQMAAIYAALALIAAVVFGTVSYHPF
jgi:hypothetical protein